jgi:acyl carrier protein
MLKLDEANVRAAAMDSIGALIGRPLRKGETLISSGLIDSLSVLRLIGELERRLSVTLNTASLQPDDFDNMDLIVETVHRAAQPAVR